VIHRPFGSSRSQASLFKLPVCEAPAGIAARVSFSPDQVTSPPETLCFKLRGAGRGPSSNPHSEFLVPGLDLASPACALHTPSEWLGKHHKMLSVHFLETHSLGGVVVEDVPHFHIHPLPLWGQFKKSFM
jgi:hypothetical protein